MKRRELSRTVQPASILKSAAPKTRLALIKELLARNAAERRRVKFGLTRIVDGGAQEPTASCSPTGAAAEQEQAVNDVDPTTAPDTPPRARPEESELVLSSPEELEKKREAARVAACRANLQELTTQLCRCTQLASRARNRFRRLEPETRQELELALHYQCTMEAILKNMMFSSRTVAQLETELPADRHEVARCCRSLTQHLKNARKGSLRAANIRESIDACELQHGHK